MNVTCMITQVFHVSEDEIVICVMCNKCAIIDMEYLLNYKNGNIHDNT